MRVIPKRKLAPLGLAGLAAATLVTASGTAAQAAPSDDGMLYASANGVVNAAGTADDCHIRDIRKPWVSGGYLRGRVTVYCSKPHDISILAVIQREAWPSGNASDQAERNFHNVSGSFSLDVAVSCNEVSPRTKYRTKATFNDIQFWYPIEIETDVSGGAYGC